VNNLGDDMYAIWTISRANTIMRGHWDGSDSNTQTGIFSAYFWDRIIDGSGGFRALVMICGIMSHLVTNVSDWVRVDVTC
jgi:hypothetical protein